MKQLAFLLSLFCCSFLYSQSLSGKISLKDGKKIGFTEITATQNKDRAAAVTDESGIYDLSLKNNGSYEVSVYIDGEKLLTKKVEVSGNTHADFVIENPAPPVEKGEKNLEAVTVTGKKKIFERKVDRLVYNVENSVASQGVDGMEALSKTPLLRVKDEAITIAGKGNVAVLVNDRPLNLSGQDLSNYLKSLRSDDIQRIEVITTPPAKYAAEGSSGLINIVLKKNTKIGWNGTIRVGGRVQNKFSYNNGATFNYQGKKLSLTANTSIGEYNGRNTANTSMMGDNLYWETKGWSNYQYRYGSANLKTEYKFNDKHTAGVGFTYNPAKPKNIGYSETDSKVNGVSNVFSSQTNVSSKYDNYNTNAFYEIKLDTLGSKINFSGNVMTNESGGDNYISTYGLQILLSNSVSASTYKISNGQIDLEQNFKKIRTEAGVKYAKIRNTADLKYFDIANNLPVLNPGRSNYFEYDEQNFAAYASANFKISEKWDTKLGLRYEYTTTEGLLADYNLKNTNRYGKFFPTLYLNYKPNDNNAFSLNYSRRIQRPYFENLNPFRYYSSNYEYWSGNPYLTPSFTHNVELSYVLKNNFTTSVYGSYTKDETGEIQKLENGIRYSTIENFYDVMRTGININYNFTKLKWLESNISASGYFSKSKAHDASAIGQEGIAGNLNMDNNFFLNKAKTVTYIFGFYLDSPGRSGISRNYGYNYFYTGLKLNLMNKNLMINLMVNDLFNSSNWKGEDYYSNFTTKYLYRNYNRGVGIFVTYKFGNQNVQGATKQIRNDEESRSGGGKGAK